MRAKPSAWEKPLLPYTMIARSNCQEPLEPLMTSLPMTADQQIRAKALECAVRFVCAMPVEEVLKAKVAEPLLWHNCAEFERYIREGK